MGIPVTFTSVSPRCSRTGCHQLLQLSVYLKGLENKVIYLMRNYVCKSPCVGSNGLGEVILPVCRCALQLTDQRWAYCVCGPGSELIPPA